MNRIQSLALSTLVALGVPLSGQSTPTPPVVQSKEPELNPATLRQMKTRLFILQHRDPNQLQRVLWALGSGVPGATIGTANQDGLNSLSVRDFPENIAVIEEAIKRLDVAAPAKSADIELHIQVLFASKQPTAEGSVPDELQPVIKSLKGALAYRGYTLAASFIQRSDPRSGRSIEGKGQIDGTTLTLGTTKGTSQLRLEWKASYADTSYAQTKTEDSFQLAGFSFSATDEYEVKTEKGISSGVRNLAQIATSVNLKEGEHVVVGTTMVKDHGLIVVLSARRVN